MTKDKAKEIEARVAKAYEEGIVDTALINDVRNLLTTDGKEVNVEECGSLSNQTSLKITYRNVMGIDGPEKAIGIRFKKMGIEFAKI